MIDKTITLKSGDGKEFKCDALSLTCTYSMDNRSIVGCGAQFYGQGSKDRYQSKCEEIVQESYPELHEEFMKDGENFSREAFIEKYGENIDWRNDMPGNSGDATVDLGSIATHGDAAVNIETAMRKMRDLGGFTDHDEVTYEVEDQSFSTPAELKGHLEKEFLKMYNDKHKAQEAAATKQSRIKGGRKNYGAEDALSTTTSMEGAESSETMQRSQSLPNLFKQ